ncbi:unnamed protein product [Paramecium octaurelia]|uniref:B30.2/SPRY domain-containing protein n=1 Tax=Paramecium octaurelia TaxID=43137 RepID=A0A8S1XKH8_PAROT|nr:unnamed protein product [Paramecium octaurelia]
MTDTGFECSLCMKLAIKAQICEKCGFMYCKQCLREIFGKSYECVQCQSKQFRSIKKSALQDAYDEILTKSQIVLAKKVEQPPQKYVKPVIVEQAIQQQFLQGNCINFEMCHQIVNQQFINEQVCSLECLYFSKLFPFVEQQDFTRIRKEIINLEQSIKNKEVNPIFPKLPLSFALNQTGLSYFNFDKCGQGIVIKQSIITLQEEEYTFKTVTCSVGFQKGIHFWKIIPMAMTKNEMKIGVSTSDKYDLKTAFSDYSFGYAYYTVGQFRNGSNSNGFEYGVKFKNTGEVGILLDMNRGVLAFSYNDNFLGKAISSDLLKKGPIYPCVALLHQAGFEFKCGIPIPQNLLEQFQK